MGSAAAAAAVARLISFAAGDTNATTTTAMEETREATGEGVVVQTDGPTGKFMNQPLLSTAPHPKMAKKK